MKKIKFSIPGFYLRGPVNEALLNDYVNNRYLFNEDIEIDSCYDCFPCAWNSGRNSFGPFNFVDLYRILHLYNSNGIGLRYTFTNALIEDKHLGDPVGNLMLDLTSKRQLVKTGLNVTSDILKNYVDTYYKDDFYFLTSTTLGKTDPADINQASLNSIVVPDYSINNKFDIIEKLENKENIEFLVGEACIDNCPSRKFHYEQVSKNQLLENGDINFPCPNGCENYDYDLLLSRKHYISIDDIRNEYVPRGFYNFKISGRLDSFINLVEKYVRYLIKPEYQDSVRNHWLNILFKDISEELKNYRK